MRKQIGFVCVAGVLFLVFSFTFFISNGNTHMCECSMSSNKDIDIIESSLFFDDDIVSNESDFLEDNAVSSSDDENSISNTDIFIKKIIDVPTISQYPDLPTGCEAVAATMLLRYYGVDITAQYFAENWLECSESFYNSGGKLYGPDPNEVFAGNPFTKSSYGCYAQPIVNAINRNSEKLFAKKITHKSLEELCSEYIDNDMPLLIWATMSMKESSPGNSWYLNDGTAFTWTAGEHCLVLVGYDEEYYFLNDPMSGSTVGYQKKLVEKRFIELGMQAVCVYEQ